MGFQGASWKISSISYILVSGYSLTNSMDELRIGYSRILA